MCECMTICLSRTHFSRTHTCVTCVPCVPCVPCVTCVTCPIHTCGLLYSYHHTHTWRIHVCDRTDLYVRHYSCLCAMWLLFLFIYFCCGMTPSCVCRDSFMCVTWRVHVCGIISSCVWHDSFMCVTCAVKAEDSTSRRHRHRHRHLHRHIHIYIHTPHILNKWGSWVSAERR